MTDKPILRSGRNPQGWALEELCRKLAQEVEAKNVALRDDTRSVATLVRFNNRTVIRMLLTIAETQRMTLQALGAAPPRD